MCFFHVMSNIKKFQKSNKSLVTDDDFNLIKDNIRKKMKKNGKMVKKNLRKNGQNKVYIYISILMNDGLMENSVSGKCIIILQDKVLMVVKIFFNKRKRLSMKCAVEKIGECIKYYSENAKPFSIRPRIYRRMTQKAANISKNNFNKASKSSATYYSRESIKLNTH
jgi:hypothetical protein